MITKAKRQATLFGVHEDAWLGALSASPASDRLLAKLPTIGTDLLLRGKTGEIDPSIARELGSILLAIRRGEPANKLFRQDKRTKPKRDGFNVAFVYWYIRACAERLADDSEALAVVKSNPLLKAPAAAASVRKLAQKNRARVFKEMEGKGRAQLGERFLWAFPGWPINADGAPSAPVLAFLRAHEVDPAKVARLREYLRLKSPHARG